MSSSAARATSWPRPRSARTSSKATSSRSTTSTRSSTSSAPRETDKEAAERLTERFGLSEKQTDAILEMRLRRLTGLERTKIEEELDELREKIAYYKQRPFRRRTLVQRDHQGRAAGDQEEVRHPAHVPACPGDAKDIDVEDLIAEENMVVTMTKAGYVKRLPVATYRQQKRGGKGMQGVNLKDNDYVEHLFVASTHSYMLFFSTKGKVYRLKVYELPEAVAAMRAAPPS